MTSLTKKLTAALLALLAALCLAFGVLLASPRTASAAETVIEIPDTDLVLSGTELTGFKSLLDPDKKYSVTIPSNITKISENVFKNCGNIVKVKYLAANLTNVEKSPFLGIGNADVIIGESSAKITFIPSNLFRGTNIHSVVLNINAIETGFGQAVFADCKKLVRAEFADGSSLVKLNNESFDGCSSLAYVKLPSDLNTIDERAFRGCTNLKEIEIPASVKNINKDAFTLCTGLVEVRNLSSLTVNTGNGIAGSTGLSIQNAIDNATTGSWFKTVSVTVGGTPYNFRTYEQNGAKYLTRYDGNEQVITLPDNASLTNYTVANGAFRSAKLTEATVSKGVAAIDDEAFMDCASLAVVKFEDMKSGISTLKTHVFNGCASLSEIKLPESLKSIEMAAFSGCAALTEIIIPTNVTQIGTDAFKACTGLKKVTLPNAKDASVSVQSTAFANCRAIQFIAPNNASYKKYATNDAFNGGELVYLINYKLHYGASATGDNVKEFSEINTAGMPKWDGYAKSVWYYDAAFTRSAPDNVDNLENVNTQVVLYCKTMAKPKAEDFKVKSITYNAGGYLLNADTLFGSENASKYSDFKFVISEYGDMTWKPVELTDKTRLTEAGHYTVSVLIANEAEYGQWAEESAVKLPVTLSPKEIQIEALYWGTVGTDGAFGGLLPADGTSTLYKYDNDDAYYTEKQYDGDTEKPHIETSRNGEYETVVTNSYVDYKGESNATVIGLKNLGRYTGKIINVSYADEEQAKPGVHTTTATVTTHNNYKLVSDGNNEELKLRGITVSQGFTPDKFVVSKTWYIISTNMNGLVTAEKNPYTISGWEYGYRQNTGLDAVRNIPLPSLVQGDIAKLVTFSLTMSANENTGAGASIIIESFKIADFEEIMNTSMPAGEYVLHASILDYKEGDTLILAGRDQDIKFTVQKAKIENLLIKRDSQGGIIYNGLLDAKQVIPNNGVVVYADYKESVQQLGDVKNSILPVLGLKAEQIHPKRTGVWAEEDYDDFYAPFSIKYCVGVMGTYYDEFSPELTNKPSGIGDYTVYYQVSAPGYDDSYNSMGHYYSLYIRGTISPAVKVTPYTGKHIELPNNDYYEVIYLDDSTALSKNLRQALGVEASEYINVGAHTLVLKLKANYKNTARWNIEGDVQYIDHPNYGEEYIRYTLNIEKANNAGTQTPTLVSWEWGKYNPSVHVPHWATRFEAEYNFYLVSATKPTTDPDSRYYYKPTELQKGFADAPADEYFIFPMAYGTANVKEYPYPSESSMCGSVTVLKAELTWKTGETPFINSWKYGDDAAGFKLPAGVLDGGFAGLIDEVTVKILLQSDYDKYVNGDDVTTYATIKELQDANGGSVPANNYVYVYYLAGTDNFAEWFYPVSFSVLRATNYWDIAPVVNSWSYGDYTTLIGSFKPHFGDAKAALIEICEIDEDGTRGSMGSVSVLLDGNGQLPMGKYEYRVVLNATANYERLVFENVTFEVFKAENSWETIPGIIGWSEGRFNSSDSGVSNKPVAKARFGTVVYYTVVSDDTGETVIERVAATDIRYADLNKLAVGSYTLIAEVDGDVSYGGLRSETHFAVFEDSVGLAGLIAATMVFAAIALGLAVAGIVLLIRRNRKIEQEFRKMVKTELRRK